MFNFLLDAGNYDERCVGRYDHNEKSFVSTARVSDGRKPYETAVKHPEYNGGKMMIVENYDTKQEAADGHTRWVKALVEDTLPDVIHDCQNAGVAEFLSAIGGDDCLVYKRNRV